jgi:hypothetical protein
VKESDITAIKPVKAVRFSIDSSSDDDESTVIPRPVTVIPRPVTVIPRPAASSTHDPIYRGSFRGRGASGYVRGHVNQEEDKVKL